MVKLSSSHPRKLAKVLSIYDINENTDIIAVDLPNDGSLVGLGRNAWAGQITNIQSIESRIKQEIPDFSLLSNIPSEIVDKYRLKTKIYRNPYLNSSLLAEAEYENFSSFFPIGFNTNTTIGQNSIVVETPMSVTKGTNTSSEVGIFKVSSNNGSFSNVGTLQIGTNELSLSQFGITQISPTQISPTQISEQKISSTQVNSTQVSTTQIGSTQFSTTQIGFPQINPTKVSFPSSITLQQLFSIHNSDPSLNNTYKAIPLPN